MESLAVTVKGDRTILNASGHIRGGEITAIMGPSGAGKTTLLNVITQLERVVQKTKSRDGKKVAGRVQLMEWDEVEESASLASSSVSVGFVTVNESSLFPNLTPLEHIMYRLRLTDVRLSYAEVRARAMEVLELVRIGHVKDSLVGYPHGTGLSSGERKRLSIAIALATDPDILVLDEPTTSLDAALALSIMELLRDLAETRVVVLTIHQPQPRIFQMLGTIFLLSKGEMVYMGPADEVRGYFESLGFDCPTFTNIADFILDVIVQSEGDGTDLAAHWKKFCANRAAASAREDPPAPQEPANVEATTRVVTSITVDEESSGEDEDSPGGGDEEWDGAYGAPVAPSLFRQTLILTERGAKIEVRHGVLYQLWRPAQTCIIGLLVGALAFRVDANTQEETLARANVLFTAYGLLFTFSFPSVARFIEERRFALAEGRQYSTVAYFLSMGIIEFFGVTLAFGMFCGILYPMVGLRPDAESIAYFLILSLVVANQAYGLCQMIGAMIDDTPSAFSLTIFSYGISVLTAGYLFFHYKFPIWLIWLYYGSPSKYAMEGLLLNEMEDRNFCNDADQIFNSTNSTACIDYSDELLDLYELPSADGITKWVDLLVTVTFFFLLRVVAGIAFVLQARRQAAM